MSTLIQKLLGDTGDLAEWAEDKLDPEDLKKLADEPASVLWVVRFVRRVHMGCWVMRWVRNFRVVIAFGFGVLAAINAVGWLSVRSMIRESNRATVIQTLKEFKIISATPSPATGESVASLGGPP